MSPKFILIFLIALGLPALAEDRPPPSTWHLMTRSRGGMVSLVKNLTDRECNFMRSRALGLPATPEEEIAEAKRHPAGSFWMTQHTEGDIETAECFE